MCIESSHEHFVCHNLTVSTVGGPSQKLRATCKGFVNEIIGGIIGAPIHSQINKSPGIEDLPRFRRQIFAFSSNHLPPHHSSSSNQRPHHFLILTNSLYYCSAMTEPAKKASLLQSMALGGAAASFAVNFTHPIVSSH